MDLEVWQSFVKEAAHSAEELQQAVQAVTGKPFNFNNAPGAKGPSFLQRMAPVAAVGALGLGAYALGRHHGKQDRQYPDDYHATRELAMQKLGWSWEGFKEGIRDEGIPLGGAALGAAIGGKWNKGLTGAALGYAAGGGASLLRSRLRGEEPSQSQKILAMSALGYGLGGLGHAAISRRLHGGTGMAAKLFQEHSSKAPGWLNMARSGIEEALPAAGAVLGTGYAMGTSHKPQPMQPLPVARQAPPHLSAPRAPQPVVPPSAV